MESIFLDESDDIVACNIDQIKELGIDVEIDDFGTGYASIVSLLKLKPQPPQDRPSARPPDRTRRQRQLVDSIIDIGRSLGIEVVAEGVEFVGRMVAETSSSRSGPTVAADGDAALRSTSASARLNDESARTS